ncbi:MAG: 4Fe-4S dicluster domain-containing protein [Acidimicrobiia bacterium]|nr:4Fe-4S dicluster domain-containing protein [Acidimicrobiia bacterium]
MAVRPLGNSAEVRRRPRGAVASARFRAPVLGIVTTGVMAASSAAALLLVGFGPLFLAGAAATVAAGLASYLAGARGSMDEDTRRELKDWVFADGVRFVDRRTALRLFGMAALFVVPFKLAPKGAQRVLAGGSLAVDPPEIPSVARTRQWSMIIDLRRCDGCQSVNLPPQCTTACIEGHFTPEPMQWIEVYEHELEGDGTRFVPTPCQHCQNPPCVNVCPVGATFSSPEGLVLIDQDRCIGCRICMAACPYDRRFFNWGEPPVPPEAHLGEYDLEVQVPAAKGTVMKCDFCPDMARSGALPFCIQGCPHRAIYYGDLEEDLATNGRELISVSRFLAENDAFQLKPELGTKPRIFYIPGHGEDVGRTGPTREGFLPIRWPWQRVSEGSSRWSR